MKNDIIKSMRLVWESLDSHLDDAIESPIKGLGKRAKRHIGGKRFHKKCVKEYAYILQVLAEKL